MIQLKMQSGPPDESRTLMKTISKMPRTLIFFLLVSTLTTYARLNIVFILADDLGIGDTKVYGGDRCLIETPNIDKLAEGGLLFTNAYVCASVCGPTRLAATRGEICNFNVEALGDSRA